MTVPTDPAPLPDDELERIRDLADDDIATVRDMRLVLAELERLNSWHGLMSVLDEKYPEDIFPTREDDIDRDPGPRIVSLVRWVDRFRAENTALAAAVARLNDRCNNDLAQMSRLIEERYTAKKETEKVQVKLDRVRDVKPMDAATDVPEFAAKYVEGWNDALVYVRAALGETGGTDG
jgi:hypothetical protein